MDAEAIVGLRVKLARFLRRFSHCGNREVAEHVATYVEGQLSELERKNVEQMDIGIIDETSFVKKGTKTPGVQRQHCGAVEKHENCDVQPRE